MKRFFSILLIISLVCSVALFASGTAFAASGDPSGTFSDFLYFYCSPGGALNVRSPSSSNIRLSAIAGSAFYYFDLCFSFPADVISGSLVVPSSFVVLSGDDLSNDSTLNFGYSFIDSSGAVISGGVVSYSNSIAVPSSARFLRFRYMKSSSSSLSFVPSSVTYSNFVYDLSSGADVDLSVIESLLSYSDQTYTTYSGAYDWSNHQFSSTSTWSDFGSAFQSLLYSNSGAAILLTQLLVGDANNTYALDGVTYNNLPSYLIALGNKLSLTYSAQANTQAIITSRFNSVDSDLGVLLTNSAAILAAVGDLRSGVSSALYADYPDDTDANKAPWSVAEWLRGIYSSLSGFISGFWSSGETAVKNAAESAYTATSSSGLIPSGSNVSDFADVAFDVKAIVSFGGSAGAAFDMYGNGDLGVLGFFTQDCMDCMDIVRAGSASLMDDDDEYSSYHANQSAVSNYLNNH